MTSTPTATLRIGVTSRVLGRSGTTHLAIDVPDFEDDALQVSPLVLGLSTDLPPDAVMGLDSFRTLAPFQPTTVRAFLRSQSLRVFARAYWKADAPPPQATLNVTGPSRLAPLAVTLDPSGTFKSVRRSGVVDKTVALGDLQPGPYVVSLEARPGKGKPIRREVPIEIR